ncbi:Hsp70 family protein [Rhodococcus triatomae]|nr:Molecular chaperone [Rhodococcus triatomae BKS 15-14]
MNTTDWWLSVDFGTSNTAAAHSGATSGRVEVLPLSHRSNLMPSAVYVDAPDRIAVGDVAANEAQRNPAGYLPAPKRLVGPPTLTVNGFTLPTSAPVAAVLRSVVARAVAAHAGTAPAGVVLTHPEAWSPEQVQVLIDAAVAAGIDPVTVTTVSEPRAAAQYYGRSHALQPGARIAVFDFGGGTLDVAVLAVDEDSSFRVIAARGDNGLGGKNLDGLVARWVDEQLDDRNPDLREYLRRGAPLDVRQALDESIRQAKELLSEAPSATIAVSGNGERETLHLTRGEFEELTAPVLDRAVTLARETLRDAGISAPDELAALYLTGGTSRIPLVHERLRELGPVATLDDPKTVVAQGALAHAGSVATAPATSAAAAGQVVPSVAELTPNWRTAPQETGTTSGRGRIVAAVAVLGVVAAAVAVGLALKGGGDDSAEAKETAATGTVDGGASSGSSGSASNTPASGNALATTSEQAVAVLPPAMQDQLVDCTDSNLRTDQSAMIVFCELDTSGELAALTKPPFNSVSIYRDQTEAKQDIFSVRSGGFEGPNSTLVESTDRMAAADISAPDPNDGLVDFTYVNINTGVKVTVHDLTDVASAKSFLTRSGLLT